MKLKRLILLPIIILLMTVIENGISKENTSIQQITGQHIDELKTEIESRIYKEKKSIPPEIIKIRKKWKIVNKEKFFRDSTYISEPVVEAPYKAGKLTGEILEEGLLMTNFVRYLARLPKVVLNTDLSNESQYGAVIIAKLGYLTHTPQKPTDMKKDFYKIAYKNTSSSNLHMSSMLFFPKDAVLGFMDDSDPSNIDRVGHRRWILNPPLKQIGFGRASNRKDNNFISMAVFDKSGNTRLEYDFIGWPSEGYFPSDFFHNQQAWSVSLNPEKYNNSKYKNITVELKEVGTDNKWVLNNSHKNKTEGKFFNVNTSNMGVPFAIIFRPDDANYFDLFKYKTFQVTINGLYTKDGESTHITYEVTFFNL